MRHTCLPLIIVLSIIYNLTFQKIVLHTNYTFEEIEVAKVISAEACSEGKLGMWGVANTIANRVKLWNKTPYQIVTQRNQYYGYGNSNKNEIYKYCDKRYVNELSKYIMQLRDITNGAIYYRLPNEPVKSWHGDKTVTIGNHTYYKEKEN